MRVTLSRGRRSGAESGRRRLSRHMRLVVEAEAEGKVTAARVAVRAMVKERGAMYHSFQGSVSAFGPSKVQSMARSSACHLIVASSVGSALAAASGTNAMRRCRIPRMEQQVLCASVGR